MYDHIVKCVGSYFVSSFSSKENVMYRTHKVRKKDADRWGETKKGITTLDAPELSAKEKLQV